MKYLVSLLFLFSAQVQAKTCMGLLYLNAKGKTAKKIVYKEADPSKYDQGKIALKFKKKNQEFKSGDILRIFYKDGTVRVIVIRVEVVEWDDGRFTIPVATLVHIPEVIRGKKVIEVPIDKDIINDIERVDYMGKVRSKYGYSDSAKILYEIQRDN